jgi:hypothetical protein
MMQATTRRTRVPRNSGQIWIDVSACHPEVCVHWQRGLGIQQVDVQQGILVDVGVVVNLATTLKATIGPITAERLRVRSRLRRVTGDVVPEETRSLPGFPPRLIGRLLRLRRRRKAVDIIIVGLLVRIRRRCLA